MTKPAWLLDVNVLLALALNTHVHHRAAHRALAAHAGTWATCPADEASLLRLLLNPAVAGGGFTSVDVLKVLAGMRRDPRWTFVPDAGSLTDPHIDLSVLVGHRQVTDLQLVNLAASTERVLVTFDQRIVECLAPADRRHVYVLAH